MENKKIKIAVAGTGYVGLIYRLQIRGKRIHDLSNSKKRECEKHPFGRRQPSD